MIETPSVTYVAPHGIGDVFLNCEDGVGEGRLTGCHEVPDEDKGLISPHTASVPSSIGHAQLHLGSDQREKRRSKVGWF